MTAHLTRRSVPLTSYYCKTGEHGEACNTPIRDSLDSTIVCHCMCHGATCHAPQYLGWCLACSGRDYLHVIGCEVTV